MIFNTGKSGKEKFRLLQGQTKSDIWGEPSWPIIYGVFRELTGIITNNEIITVIGELIQNGRFFSNSKDNGHFCQEFSRFTVTLVWLLRVGEITRTSVIPKGHFGNDHFGNGHFGFRLGRPCHKGRFGGFSRP